MMLFVGFILLLFMSYLSWLLYAALKFPVPFVYNLRSLWQRKSSTLTTASAISLVVAIFIVVLSLAQGISQAFVTSGLPNQALVMRPSSRFELNSSITRDQVRIIKSNPLVAQRESESIASAEVIVIKLFNKADGTGSNITVRGMEPIGRTMRPQVQLVAGRWFQPGLSEVTVPVKMQLRFPELAVGRSFKMGGREWDIVGSYDAAGSSFDSEIWSDATDVMQAFKRDTYSTVLVRLRSEDDLRAFSFQMEDEKRLKLEAVPERAYFKELTKAGDPIRIIGNLITVILSIGAMFSAMNTMYASVASRTKEIGTLRALGYRRREILASFQWESILLCTLGGVGGALLSFLADGIQTGTTSFDTFSDISFAFTITPRLLAQGLFFSVGMGILGGLLPAWRASNIPLTEAMKG
jgi:putative ABC transport system permease protein